MKREIILFAIVLALSGFFSGEAFADSFAFSIQPSGGDLSGSAGSTLGWGYSITNNSATRWLVPTAVDSTDFLHGTLSMLYDHEHIALAPGESLVVPYDGVHGLYAFTWDPDAPANFVNSGWFFINTGWWEWWDGDPHDPSDANAFLGFASGGVSHYSVTVTSDGGGAPAVPEPASLILLASGLGAVWLRKRSLGLSGS